MNITCHLSGKYELCLENYMSYREELKRSSYNFNNYQVEEAATYERIRLLIWFLDRASLTSLLIAHYGHLLYNNFSQSSA